MMDYPIKVSHDKDTIAIEVTLPDDSTLHGIAVRDSAAVANLIDTLVERITNGVKTRLILECARNL